MRRRHHDVRKELPAPREAAEEIDWVRPALDRLPTWVPGSPVAAEQGPQTAADRAAARRRLDRLADEW